MMVAKYPNCLASELTAIAYWEDLSDMHEHAIRLAITSASKASTQFCPPAPLVREHAEAHAKNPAHVVPDLSRPALGVHDETLDETNPHYETWQRVKRGEITQAQATRIIVDGICK